MILLRALEIKRYRSFKKKFLLEFKNDITLLVGNQGCGKSTILDMIKRNDTEHCIGYNNGDRPIDINTLKFSPEKDNPRDGSSMMLDMYGAYALHSHFISHGQSLMPIYEDLANDKELKNYVVMFDEPETALHISSIHKIIKMFKDMSKDNQLIIATHHPTIMLAFGEVYDLERKKYVKAKKYLEQYGC